MLSEATPTPELSLPALLRRNAAMWGEAPVALTAERNVSFSELMRQADEIGHTLLEQGIEPGRRVGLICGNSPEFLASLFGIFFSGAVAVPFSTWSTRAELDFLIKDSAVDVIFAMPRFADRDFASDLAVLSGGADSQFPKVIWIGEEGRNPVSEMDASPTPKLPQVDPDADAMILYTSGSASHPKGVRLTHRAICENGYQIGVRQGLHPGDRVMLTAPLFWSYGVANALPAAFSHGAALVLAERFEPGVVLALIAQHRCTAIYTLPTITDALVRHPDFSADVVASLRTGLTIGTPEDIKFAIERLGVPEICNIYGATETYGNCCVTPHEWPASRRIVCQGPSLPGMTLRIRDSETGELCVSNEVGLIEVGGRVSPGYAGRSADLNSEAFVEDGFYRTGDLGRIDADGNLEFVGRNSEMIKRAGINVSPQEVELVLQGIDGVARCCVTGVPDRKRGDLIVAFVVRRRSRTDIDEPMLLKKASAVLSKYKLPDRVLFRETLPLTPTGKILRRSAQEEAIRVLASENAEVAA